MYSKVSDTNNFTEAVDGSTIGVTYIIVGKI